MNVNQLGQMNDAELLLFLGADNSSIKEPSKEQTHPQLNRNGKSSLLADEWRKSDR
jgi:hypothetical protein